MNIYYSPSTKGFYHSKIQTTPVDVVCISEAEYRGLMKGQSEGKIIDFDPTSAKPFVSEIVHDEQDVLRLKREMIIDKRNSLLAASDWTMLPDVKFDEQTKAAWVKYRQELRDITLHPNFPNIELPAKPSSSVQERQQ